MQKESPMQEESLMQMFVKEGIGVIDKTKSSLVMLLPIEEQEQTRMMTDDELFKVEKDYGNKDAVAVGDILNYRRYSQDEQVEAKRMAVAREKGKKGKLSKTKPNTAIVEEAVNVIKPCSNLTI